MKIIIIGTGNVAFHLAKAFHLHQISVEQIFGRNVLEGEKIAHEIGSQFSTDHLAEADLYLIAVADSAVPEVSKLIKNKNALVAHTSGSLTKEVLIGNYKKACFYPLQTFSKGKSLNYSQIPFFVEAQNEADEKLLVDLALKISNKVQVADYEKRKYIHLTAVFACNFVNHLFARAKELSDSQSIPFDYFLPLIDETVEKIHFLDPKLAQTGPAVRNDQRILELHKKLLHDPQLVKIYTTLNHSILEMYHPATNSDFEKI